MMRFWKRFIRLVIKGIEGRFMISKDYRRKLMERLEKTSSLIGKEIPDLILINGEELKLSNTVLSLIKKDEPSKEDIKISNDLRILLLKKEEEDEIKLKNLDLTKQEANGLYEEILGLKRAIFSLEGVGKEKKDDIKNLYQAIDVEDMKRWGDFLKKVR